MPTRAREKPGGGRNRQAVEVALKSLSARIGDDLAALVETCRSLADSVDADPHVAALWKEYRGALADLREATAVKEDGGDGFDKLIASLST